MQRAWPVMALLAALVLLAVAGCDRQQATERSEQAQTNMPGVAEHATEKANGKADSADCVITPPAEPISCTMEYAPVCGCDGKTYSNACRARAAGVPHSTAGACEASDQL